MAIVRSSSTASSSRRSCVTSSSVPSKASSARLELLDRRQVEVVRRLVEHEPVRAGGHQLREARARALARRERVARAGRPRRSRARTWPAASAPPAGACPLRATNASSSGPRPRSRRAPGRASRSARPARPSACPPRAAAGRAAPRPASSCRCRWARRARRARPTPARGRAGRARRLPRRITARVEARGDVARALAAAEAQLQLPAPPRLVDLVEALDRLLGRADLRRLLLRALRFARGGRSCPARRCVLALRTPVSDHWRWRLRAVGQPVALR